TEPAFAERVLAAASKTTGVREVVLVEGNADGARTLGELEATPPPAGFEFDAAWRSVSPDSPITLIFTSGTTGEPKGVQHTHSSILYMLRSLNQVSPVSPGGRVVSFLPMAHIA